MIKLGVIGYGGRGAGMVAHMEFHEAFGAKLVALCDADLDGARQRLIGRDKDPASVRLYDDPDRMLDDEDLDAVMVSTRCSGHGPMAIKVLARNLPLFIEKPVVTTLDDYAALAAALAKSTSPTLVSFPMRLTPLARTAWRVIDSGRLGPVTHVQGTNNVPYGEVYYQTWYRDEDETGGLFLQKATHDIDLINRALGEVEPACVAAMSSKLVFRGDRPAGLKCVDCGERHRCLESRYNKLAGTGAKLQAPVEEYQCAFASDTGNEDSGNVLIEYANGVQAVHTQNFYSRRGAACRKIRVIGHRGTLEFDYATEQAVVWIHHHSTVERYDCRADGEAHGGGDKQLAVNFLRMLKGEAESAAPLAVGLRSALICLLARESAATRQFQDATKYAAALAGR